MLIVAFFSSHEVSAWTFPDWLTVVGFPAVVLALLLAWRHIGAIKDAAGDARDASQAARAASEKAEGASDAAKAGSDASKDAATTARAGAVAAQLASEEARDAAKAAREAITRTEQKIADQNVLMLIGQVQGIINDLDRAEREEEILRLASEWIQAASELDAILKAGRSFSELSALLSPSVESAGLLKNAIIERKDDPEMPDHTRGVMAFRKELTAIRAKSSSIMGHMRAFVGDEPDA